MSVLKRVAIAIALATSPARAQDFTSIFAQSHFDGQSPPAEALPGVPYQPVMLAALTSLRSREPARTGTWDAIALPPLPGSYCPGPFKAHWKREGGARTFVILPGSFSTWDRGGFNNQTVAELERQFGESRVLSFAGYLTKESLTGVCDRIPWDSLALAEDLYARLRVFLSNAPTGLVGFSGGGYIAIGMMAADARAAAKEKQRLFTLGGLAVSPLLHGRTAFANLDEAYRASPIPPTNTFLSWDWDNLRFLAANLGPPSWRELPALFARDPVSFTARTFNQFHADLRDVIEAVGARVPEPLGYERAFVVEGFGREIGGDAEAFDRATSLESAFHVIDRPFVITFAEDDPFLSNWRGTGQPAAVTRLLDAARANPRIRVFNPRFGGHAGLLLEPFFGSLLKALFD